MTRQSTTLGSYWPTLLAAGSGLPESTGISESSGIRDRLLVAYDDPDRGYHNQQHLAEVFTRIDLILAAEPEAPVDRDVVLLAAWFHDAVYDLDGDNEQRSAALAERELATIDVPPALIEEVARLVLLTKTHDVAADDLIGAVLCDADLGILAADEQRYAEYTQGVRREYQHVADEDFRKGRAGILRDLLAAPTLFNTTFAKQHWENSARANVARELVDLEA